MSNTKDNALNYFGSIIDEVEKRLEICSSQHKALPTTTFAKEMAPTFNTKWPQIYHMIGMYVGTRDDLQIKGGPQGGIVYREKNLVQVINSEEENNVAEETGS